MAVKNLLSGRDGFLGTNWSSVNAAQRARAEEVSLVRGTELKEREETNVAERAQEPDRRLYSSLMSYMKCTRCSSM